MTVRRLSGHDEEMVKMNSVNEVFNQLTTDINYINQSELNADESIINFRNGLLPLKAGSPKLMKN